MATIQDIFDWLNQGAQGDIPGTGGEQPNTGASSQPQMAGDVIAPEFRQGMPQNDQSQLNDQWPGGGPFNWGALPLGPHLVTPQQPTPVPGSPGTPANEASAEPRAQEAAEKGAQAGQKAGQGLWAMLFGKQPQKTPQDYTSDIPPTSLMHYQALISQGIPPDVARYILTQPSLGEGESPAHAGYSAQSYAGEEQDKLAGKFDFPLEPPIGEQMWSAREAQQQNLPVAEGQTQGSSSGLQQLPTGQYVPYPSQGLDYWAAQGNPQSFYWNPQPGSSWLNDLLGSQ